jgi:uncharacterized protein (DUF58 family)
MLMLLALGIPVGLVPVFFGWGAWIVWAAYLVACALLVAYDTWTLPVLRSVDVETPDILAIASAGSLVIRLVSRSAKVPSDAEALLDLDEAFEPPPAVPIVWKEGNAELVIPLVPRRRGVLGIMVLWLRWTGPLGLMRRTVRHPLDRRVSVVPALGRVRQEALALLRQRDVIQGSRASTYLSEGSEFDALREYSPGHNHRAIDWKASAHHTRLLVRQYRAERNHQVVVAIDTGHLMMEPVLGLPKLDHGIEAGILLSYVSLRHGDRVGLFAFDSRVRHYTEPRSGLSAMDRLLREFAALEPSPDETNFTLGFTDLARRLRRRSLVILFSDFVDTITSELMVESLGRVARRHLVLTVTLNDFECRDLARRRPETPLDVTRSVVAQDLLLEREKVLSRLRRLGIHVIAADPGMVSASLVNRYLSIMRRELVG